MDVFYNTLLIWSLKSLLMMVTASLGLFFLLFCVIMYLTRFLFGGIVDTTTSVLSLFVHFLR